MKGIIYIATNLFSGKSYIGQTRTTLERRMNQHLRDAKSDGSNHFHYALSQYGKSGFEWKVLDEFEGTKEEVIHALNVAEEYHILKRKTMLDEHGYNATKGGYSSDVFADEIRRRALANYGGKAVLQYDLDGNFIREFESIAEVGRHMRTKNKGKSFIGRAWKGYQWREKVNENYPHKISPHKPTAVRTRRVVAYSTDGYLYGSYKSLSDCRSVLGRQYAVRKFSDTITLRRCHKGIFLVFYDDGSMPEKINVKFVSSQTKQTTKIAAADQSVAVLQYSREGCLLGEFPSISQAHRETGVGLGTIRKSCKRSLPYPLDMFTKYIWRIKQPGFTETIDVVDKPRAKSYSCKPTKRYSPKKEHRVVQCDKQGEVVKVWDNMYQASLLTGESHGLIRKQCMGISIKKKTPSIWRYYSDFYAAI